jgi:hypothetical protein
LLFLDAIATTAKAKNSSSGYRPPGRYSHVLYPQILLQTHFLFFILDAAPRPGPNQARLN